MIIVLRKISEAVKRWTPANTYRVVEDEVRVGSIAPLAVEDGGSVVVF
jgi:hypothetical protein